MFGVEPAPALAADGVVRLGTDLCNWFLLEAEGRVVVVDAGLIRRAIACSCTRRAASSSRAT
jgi:hypothetical protein